VPAPEATIFVTTGLAENQVSRGFRWI